MEELKIDNSLSSFMNDSWFLGPNTDNKTDNKIDEEILSSFGEDVLHP